MAVRSYDPASVIITIGGVIMGGFADGTFITIERETDTFTKVTGADGVVSRAKSNDKSALLTLTLAQTSPSNDALSILHNIDELTAAGVIPVLIKDLLGRSLYIAGNGWIRRPAGYEGAKEITDREWMIDLAETEWFTGGNGSL